MKRILLFILLFLALFSAAANAQTYEDWYVDTDVSGGAGNGTSWANAYSSVDAAVDAKAGDLVTAQKIVRINVRGSTNADTTRLVTSGYTTDASYYLWIKVDSEDRHAGVWSTSKYRLVASVSNDELVDSLPAYTILEGMQIHNTSGTGSRVVNTGARVYLYECIIRGGYNYGVFLTGGSRAYNCMFYGSGNGPGLQTNSYTSGVTIVHCTSVNNKTYGFYAAIGTTLTAINCYAGGNESYDWAKAGTLTLTNCYSADESQSTSPAAFSTDNFVNVTATSENLHLVSGSALIGVGSTSASSYISIDIDGNSRPQGGSWDVGADEYVTSGSVIAPYYLEN